MVSATISNTWAPSLVMSNSILNFLRKVFLWFLSMLILKVLVVALKASNG